MAQHEHFIEKTAHDFDIDLVSDQLHKLLIDTIEEQRIDFGQDWTEANVAIQELVGTSTAGGADKVRLEALQTSINNRVNNRQWNQKAYHKFLKFFKKRSVRDFVDLALLPASAFGAGAITGPAVSAATGVPAPTSTASDATKKAWDLANQLGSFTIDLLAYSESEGAGNQEDWIADKSGYPSLKSKLRGNSINAVIKELVEDGETHIKRSARQLGSAVESLSILRAWEPTVKKGHEDGATWKRTCPESGGSEEDPWKFVNCDEAITLGFLSCNFLHHYDKLRVHSWEVFKYVNFLSSRIGEWNKLWDTMRDTAPVGNHLKDGDHSACSGLCYGPKDGQPAVPKNPLASWALWETDLGLSREQIKTQETANHDELEKEQADKLKAKEEKQVELDVCLREIPNLTGEIETFDREALVLRTELDELEDLLDYFAADTTLNDDGTPRSLLYTRYLRDRIDETKEQLNSYSDAARKVLTDKLADLGTQKPILEGELETLDQELGVLAASLDSEPESKRAKATAATYRAKSGAPKAISARLKRLKNWFSVTGLQDPDAPPSALRVKGSKGKHRVNEELFKGSPNAKFTGTRLEEDAASETPARLNRLLTLLNDIWWPIEHKSRGHRMKRKWGRWSMYREHTGRKALRFAFVGLSAATGVVIIVATGGAAAPLIAVGIGTALWSADKLSGDKLNRRFAKGSQEQLEKMLNEPDPQLGEIRANVAIEAHQGAKATLKRGAAVRRQFVSCEKNFQRMLYFSHKRVHPRDPAKSLAPFEFADCEDAASFMWAAAKFRRHYCKLVKYITPITLYSGTLLQTMQAMEAYWWGEKGYQDETARTENLDSFDGATASDPPENMRAVVMGAIKKTVFQDKKWHDEHCGTTPKDRSDRTFRVRRRGRNNIAKPYANQLSAMCYGPVQSCATDDAGIAFKHKRKARRPLNLGHTFTPNTTNIETGAKHAVPTLLRWAWGNGWAEFLRESLALADRAADATPAAPGELAQAIAQHPTLSEAPLDGALDATSNPAPEDGAEVEGDGSATALEFASDVGPAPAPPPSLDSNADPAALLALVSVTPTGDADPGGDSAGA